MSRPRVVLDTNVVVSALVFAGGRLAWVRDGWHSGAFKPLVSRQVAKELLGVLEYPKLRLDAFEREALLGDYLPMCEVVAAPQRIAGRIPACRDPDDRKFLELALAGKASFLVTGDADLIALARTFAVAIVTVQQFREVLAAGGAVVRERASAYAAGRRSRAARAAA